MNETVRPRAIVSGCLARICALLICVISVLALMGWASGWLSLARMNPKYIPIAPSTALAFTLLSAGLFVHVRWPTRRYCSQFSAVAAILVSGLAGLLLLRFTGIFDFDPEQFLLKNPESFRGVPIGRMSPLTAAGLLLESFALIALLLAFPWWMASPSLPACLSVSATAVSLVVLIGYAYGTPLLYGGTIIPVALPTAVAMLLYGLGLLAAADPHAWPLCLILGAPVHARILRAFLPVTLLAVVGEGWLINALMPHHNTNTALWVSLVVLISTAVVSVVIAFVSRGIGGAIEQAKAALLESEEKFRSIYEGSNDAIMLLTENGFFNCNKRTLEIFGLSCKDEFVSMHLSQLSPPLQPNGQDSRTAANEKIAMAFDQGSDRFDWMYRRKNGEDFPAEVLLSAFDYQGKKVLQATVRDITERKSMEDQLRRSQENLINAQRIAHLGSWEWDVVKNESFYSDETYRIFGLKPQQESLTYERLHEFIHPDDREFVRNSVTAALSCGNAYSIDYRIVRPDGSECIVHAEAEVVFNKDGKPLRMVGTVQDITERKKAEERLKKYEMLFSEVNDLVYFCDTKGNILFLNKIFEKLTGHKPEEFYGKSFESLFEESNLKKAHDIYTRTLRGEYAEDEIYFKDTGILCEYKNIPMYDEKKNIIGVMGIARDITKRKQNDERLIFLAEHDPLTELHNRRYFIAQLKNWVPLMKRRKESGSLILLDLDNFKYINDTLGHQEGDWLLVKLAGVLRKHIRETDVIASLGGDEFAIMLPFTTQEQAQAVSEKILLSIKEHCRIDKILSLGTTASIGIVQFPEYGDDAILLLSCADIAMYAAKEEGRNRVCVFESKHKEKIDSWFVWENRIQKALNKDLFALYLQPIYDIQQEIVCGYEVLLRMHGENLEILMPDDFLPVAERYGLIHEIDRWVVRNAIRLVAAYKVSEKGQFFDINLSGKAFNDKGLLSLIQREISETGISPKSIMFEITETASMENMIEADSFISTLKLIGCRFALDDFGSGFSSYQNLKHLPVDYLKIDGSFIRNLHESRMDQHLIRGIVEMARGLEKKTVAEYVENEKTLQLLREYGVDCAQGYYIGKPSPAGEVLSNSLARRREHTEIAERLAEDKQK
ncbi:MAG: EAL domain-containing protein [Candidatus Brocadiaceae bacterium]